MCITIEQKKICKNCTHYTKRFDGEGLCKKITNKPNELAYIETIYPPTAALFIKETFGCNQFNERQLTENKKIVYHLLSLIERIEKTHELQRGQPIGFNYIIDREARELIESAKKFVRE